MGFKHDKSVPKGRIVPMYLTDEGDLYPICFQSEEQMELVSTMVGIAMEHTIVVNTHEQINNPKEKLSIYNMKEKKKIL